MRPARSHGRIFSTTCWWRAAMKRNISASGRGWRSNRRRTATPSAVPSGSDVASGRYPSRRSQRSRRRIWVDLPDPSTPSNVINTPRTVDLRIPVTVACPHATPDPQSPHLRRLRHVCGLARQHHRGGPGARPALGHRRRLAGAGRRLAGPLSAGAGRGALGPPAVDDPRRAASRVARRARTVLRPRQARRGPARPSQPRLAPVDPVAGHGGRAHAAQAPLRHRTAVQRQLCAAHEYGQARRPAVGCESLVRALPRLQAQARELSRRRRPARPSPRGDDARRRALLRPPGGARVRAAHRVRASAPRIRRPAEERPAGGSESGCRRERLRGSGGKAGELLNVGGEKSRSATGSPGRSERWGVWGAISGPPTFYRSWTGKMVFCTSSTRRSAYSLTARLTSAGTSTASSQSERDVKP